MKKVLNLSLGLAMLFLATSATTLASAPTRPVNKKVHNFKAKKVDSYFIFFGVRATLVRTGVYDIQVQYNFYDSTTGSSTDGPCPENVSITMNDTGGPLDGAQFTFPSGSTYIDLGDFDFDPNGNDYAIITNPTSLGSYRISQYLIGGHIM